MIWCIINCIIPCYIILYCIILYKYINYIILLYYIVLHCIICSTIFFLLYVQSKAPEKGSSGQRLASYFPFGITRPIFELGEPPVLGNVTRGIPQSGRNTSWRGGVQGGGSGQGTPVPKGGSAIQIQSRNTGCPTKTWECRMSLSLLHSVETCWNIHRRAIYVSFINTVFIRICLPHLVFMCIHVVSQATFRWLYMISCQLSSFSGRHFSSWPMTPWHLSERKMMMKKRRQKWGWLHPPRLI